MPSLDELRDAEHEAWRWVIVAFTMTTGKSLAEVTEQHHDAQQVYRNAVRALAEAEAEARRVRTISGRDQLVLDTLTGEAPQQSEVRVVGLEGFPELEWGSIRHVDGDDCTTGEAP